MNERLPYENFLNEQLNELSLPDENMAWEDMRRRLEKEEDDQPAIAWWRRGCLPFALGLFVLLGIGLWLWPDQWIRKQKQETPAALSSTKQKFNDLKKDSLAILNLDSNQIIKRNKQKMNVRLSDSDTFKYNATKNTEEELNSSAEAADFNTNSKVKTNLKAKKVNLSVSLNKEQLSKRNKEENTNNKLGSKNEKDFIDVSNSTNKTSDPEDRVDIIENKDSLLNQSGTTNIKIVPFISTKHDSLHTMKNPVSNKNIIKEKEITLEKTDSINIKKLSFSAGLGIQQLLPIDGQKYNPYNAQGRKNSLADYIPSLYFRASKKDKWFLQFEFRYCAPQLNKELIYQQIIIPDSVANPRFTTTISKVLKKTYYHQLPVTFNYNVFKNWSLGTGIQWNSFKTAIAEQQRSIYDNLTQQDSLNFKQIVKVKNDTANNFKKSYLQGIIETEYKWKRFSLGARYNFGLQPYLQFTLPGGKQQREKNSSLQIFLRYELWQNKNK